MRPRRLIAHNGTPFIGGGELWTIRLLKELESRGHDVEMWVRDRNIRDRVRAFGLRARVAHLGGPLMIPEALVMGLKLQRDPPDALLLTTFKKSWLGGLGGKLAGVPRVVLRIGLSTDLPRRHWTYGVALRRWVDAVVTNSTSVRDDVIGDLPGIPEGHVRTIWNGVEIPRRIPESTLHRELGLDAGARIVGSAGRLVREKGHVLLIEAVAAMPDVHCVLVGEGAYRDRLEEAAEASGAAGRIHFLGYRTDLTGVLCGLDLYVVSSVVEGMSNAMLEAMAVGIPVVSTPVSGTRDALEPLEDGAAPGRVVPADPDSLRDAIATLLDNPPLRSAMGRAARRRVETRFDAQARADEWEALLFGSPGGTRPSGPG